MVDALPKMNGAARAVEFFMDAYASAYSYAFQVSMRARRAACARGCVLRADRRHGLIVLAGRGFSLFLPKQRLPG